MKPSSAHDEQDRKLIELLKSLGSFESEYPPQLQAARRAAFLAQVDQVKVSEPAEELSAEDREIIQALQKLKTTKTPYPPELLAARRAALFQQMESDRGASLLDEVRSAILRIFRYRMQGFLRLSLALAGLVAAVLLGASFLRRPEPFFQPLPSPVAAAPTDVHVPDTGETAMQICIPEDQMSLCPPGKLDASRDLANLENGTAQPAVSKDARSYGDTVHWAAFVNDGHGGASWVSNSADSWIKIDLGQVTAINTVSLRKGSASLSPDNDPGQFVIAVALSDEYAHGDSSQDYMEYTQVFQSEATGYDGTVSQAETIQTQFPSVRARFVKITFENAGAAIEEVGVFMVQPPVLVEGSTPGAEATRTATLVTGAVSATPLPSGTTTSVVATRTRLPTDTATPSPTSTLTPSDTPSPTDTVTPIPTVPLPSGTVIPYPTSVPPTAEPSQVSSAPIVVAGNGQTLTFTCNGNASEIRGHTNTVTLLGSCSSIMVTGNGNRVFWEYGSPVVIDRGNNNSIQQL